ncbi:MAG: DUF952 domain-containing protein [Xenococcaceae cyanobacterium]
MNHKLIFHITSRSQWQKARESGIYEADSLDIEGFIHFSTLEQVVNTANLIFSGRSGLVLLCVEPEKLQAELKYEEVPGVGIFPHLYGVLNLDAVENVLDFELNSEGKFELPKALISIK